MSHTLRYPKSIKRRSSQDVCKEHEMTFKEEEPSLTQAAHTPVLVRETLEMLALKPGMTVVDCTFGAGQHTQRIADAIGEKGTLIAIDRDLNAVKRAQQLAPELPCQLQVIHNDFQQALKELIVQQVVVDAVFFDLGVSSPQIDTKERGFSYSQSAPLDMRMNQHDGLTAQTIVNTWPTAELADIFRRYGEERYARSIAKAIVKAREKQPLSDTMELSWVVANAMPPTVRYKTANPAKRVFQALRIAVNDELEQIENALPLALNILKTSGRIVVISFHSLEDRIVKRFFVEHARTCICPPGLPVCGCGHKPDLKILTKKALRPGSQEQAVNSRSSSARLRAAEKVEQQ